MLCDRDTTVMASGQTGFIQFIVVPIFEQLAQISPGISDVQLANGKININKWNVRTEAENNAQRKQ